MGLCYRLERHKKREGRREKVWGGAGPSGGSECEEFFLPGEMRRFGVKVMFEGLFEKFSLITSCWHVVSAREGPGEKAISSVINFLRSGTPVAKQRLF